MKISTIPDRIDSGQMTLPEFQQGSVWSRDRFRGLFAMYDDRRPVSVLAGRATPARPAVAFHGGAG